jgi:hypothetical protein
MMHRCDECQKQDPREFRFDRCAPSSPRTVKHAEPLLTVACVLTRFDVTVCVVAPSRCPPCRAATTAAP